MFLIFQRARVLILCSVLSQATRGHRSSGHVASASRKKGGEEREGGEGAGSPPHCRKNSIGAAIGRRGGVVTFDPAIDPRPPSPSASHAESILPARNRHTSCTFDAVTINLVSVRGAASWMRKMQRLSFVGAAVDVPRRPRPGN